MLQTVLVKPRSLCQPGQGIVFRVLCFKQGVHFHYVASWPGYLSGPKPFEENVKVGCGWSTFCGSNFFYCPKNLDVTLKNYFIESTNVKVGGGWSTFCGSNFFPKNLGVSLKNYFMVLLRVRFLLSLKASVVHFYPKRLFELLHDFYGKKNLMHVRCNYTF